MKRYLQTLAVATAVLVLPLFAYSQTSTDPQSQTSNATEAPLTGHHEAIHMTRARAELMRPLDAKKDRSGSVVQVKLTRKVTLTDGTTLPNGTILVGEVTADDMQQQGMSKLALRFNQARLKNGTEVPIKATIVGIYGPGTDDSAMDLAEGVDVPNSWTDGTLQIDQIGVVGGVDLHSKISSSNSGVFVSTKKDDVKFQEGSEIQFAIGPGKDQSNKSQSDTGQTSTSASVQK
jgi:hypothetical protein